MKYLLSLTCVLLILGCSSNNFTREKPNMPAEVEIDVNEDGTIDYRIEFREVDVDPIHENNGGFGMSGGLYPVGENQILSKREEKHLFLREVNEIQNTVNEPLHWSKAGFSKELISIHNNIEGEWQRKWEVNVNSTRSTYLLGLKMVDGNSTQLGWVELSIDRKDGDIEVVDKGVL